MMTSSCSRPKTAMPGSAPVRIEGVGVAVEHLADRRLGPAELRSCATPVGQDVLDGLRERLAPGREALPQDRPEVRSDDGGDLAVERAELAVACGDDLGREASGVGGEAEAVGVDVLHEEQIRVDDLAAQVDVEDLGDGHRGAVGDQAHGLELGAHHVDLAGQDRHVGGRRDLQDRAAAAAQMDPVEDVEPALGDLLGEAVGRRDLIIAEGACDQRAQHGIALAVLGSALHRTGLLVRPRRGGDSHAAPSRQGSGPSGTALGDGRRRGSAGSESGSAAPRSGVRPSRRLGAAGMVHGRGAQAPGPCTAGVTPRARVPPRRACAPCAPRARPASRAPRG